MKTLCTVCIANYNGELFLDACIDSVVRQVQFPDEIEIIVHDDASTDRSVDLIRQKYPDVRLLTSKENVGFCISNNRMVEQARGEFILLLNNDAALHNDALKTLHAASRQHGDGIFGLPQYNADTGELIDIGSTFDLFLNPIPNKDSKREDVGMIIGACLWLPKFLWEELGGFPDWFGSLAEDMYICCLARLWGYPVKALPDSGFDHWVGRSLGGGKITRNNTLSTTTTRRALSERNKTFVMLICYPMPALFFLFPVHVVILCLEGFFLTLLKRDKRIWLDIYWNCIKEVCINKKLLQEARQQSVAGRTAVRSISFFKPFTFMPRKLYMLVKYGLPRIE